MFALTGGVLSVPCQSAVIKRDLKLSTQTTSMKRLLCLHVSDAVGYGSVNQSDSPLVMCSVSRNRTYPIQRWMFCASGSLRIEHHSCADTVGFLCSGSARRKCIVLYAAFDVMHHIG